MYRAATWNEQAQKTTALCLLVFLVWAILSPATLSAFAGIGGYISEKLLGDGANEALYLGDGTNEQVVLGTAPTVTTGTSTITGVGGGGTVSVVVRGNLSSLNGMPRADAYFQWGYAAGALTNASSTAVVTTTGEVTATIFPQAGRTVYWRFAAGTDGTAVGTTRAFYAGGGHGTSYWFMDTLLPLVVALGMLVGTYWLTGNPIAALIASVVGIVGFYLVQAMTSLF